MRFGILVILLSVFPALESGDLQEAYQSYLTGQYDQSVKLHLLNLRSNPKEAEFIRFNIAQSYLRLDSLERALLLYEQVNDVRNARLASQAANNAGVILIRQGRYPDALKMLRRALVYDDQNDMARYNFELLSKRMQPPPTPEDTTPPPVLPPTSQEQDMSNSLNDDIYQKLIKQLNGEGFSPNEDRGRPVGNDTISVVRAKQLLRAMSKQDVQFIQQLRKVSVASTRPKGRHDW